jgi:plasmid stabilization system protein ParE
MRFRVTQRKQARQDILDLVAYIAADNPTAAAALYDAYERILATTLERTPDIGRDAGTTAGRAGGTDRAIPELLDLLSP